MTYVRLTFGNTDWIPYNKENWPLWILIGSLFLHQQIVLVIRVTP
jgi:hypothetical protein